MANDDPMLMAKINNLRFKELHGGGLSKEEVMEGIHILNEIRKIRSGAKPGAGPAVVPQIPLEKLF